jgi:hypothetical protein
VRAQRLRGRGGGSHAPATRLCNAVRRFMAMAYTLPSIFQLKAGTKRAVSHAITCWSKPPVMNMPAAARLVHNRG